MEEIWKPVKDYEGYYEVSNLGRVRSLTRTIHYANGHDQIVKGKIMQPHKTKWGYMLVGLNRCGDKKRKHVHDLVAEAFLSNPSGYTEVNHIDHNKENNNVTNLEWVTHKKNMEDMVEYNRNIGKFKYITNKQGKNGLFNTCEICRKLKGVKAKICLDCYRKKIQEHIPTRDKLIHDLLKRNFVEIGKQYGVSYNAVRKWCKNYDLPYHTKELINMTDDEILSL